MINNQTHPVPATELHTNPADASQPAGQEPSDAKKPVQAVEPTASTVKPAADTTDAPTQTEPKTKTWGEWFATPFTSIKNYFSGDEKTEEENTVTISTAIPPEKTLGERMISAVKTVLSYMALPFKFLGYVAYHVIYRPLNAFVIKPLKNAYNYFFNPEKYIAEHGSKNLSELARAAKEGVETDANKEWFKTRHYAAMAREEALKDAHKDEINRRKPQAAFHNLLKKKFNENSISLKDAKGNSHVVLKATDEVLFTDTAEHARIGTEPEADFKKRLAAYESTVAEHNKAMAAYEAALAEAKKNNTPHPEKPAPLTVIRPERTLDKVSVGSPEHTAFMESRKDRELAEMVDTLTAEIPKLKAELAKTYPGQQVPVQDEAERVRLLAEIKNNQDAAQYLKAHLDKFKDDAAYQQSEHAQHVRTSIDYHTQLADLIDRHCVIFSKEKQLEGAKETHANYNGDIADWQKNRDRLQLDSRANRTCYETEKDENGKIIKVTRVDYQFDKNKLIKNRPLPIAQQGLSWSKAKLEERPYNQYGTIYGPGLGRNREVIGWNTIPGKEKSHWFVPADTCHNNKDLGYNKHQPVVAPGTRNGKPLPLPKPSQDKGVKQATEELQNGINTPDQKKTDIADLLAYVNQVLLNAGFSPEHPIRSEDEVDPAKPVTTLDDSPSKSGKAVADDNAKSIPSHGTDSDALTEAKWKAERTALLKQIGKLEETVDRAEILLVEERIAAAKRREQDRYMPTPVRV